MSETPLTDFLATLADPTMLVRYRADPARVLKEAALPADLAALILAGHPGAIRVRAVKELERAGFAPLVSDKFIVAGDAQQPTVSTFTYNANSYTSNSYTTTTNNTDTTIQTNSYTTDTTNTDTSTTDTTTTSDQTTTTTNNDGTRSWSILQIIDQSISYFTTDRIFSGGELVIVGSGIRAITDLTLGAEATIRSAQKVLYCVADPVIERRLHALNASSESLYGLYGNDKPRIQTYQAMVEALLTPMRLGLRVCGVFYGHPGVFAWPTHQAVRIAREEGYRAEMHPGISADASLFADLGLDPSQPGCHSLEATDFLIHKRKPDVNSHFLLWQAECAGDLGFNFAGYKRHNFGVLIEQLQIHYPKDHPVIIYEATALPQGSPKIIKTSLDQIRKEQLTGISTLYFPPAQTNPLDPDMCERLGLEY